MGASAIHALFILTKFGEGLYLPAFCTLLEGGVRGMILVSHVKLAPSYDHPIRAVRQTAFLFGAAAVNEY